MSVAWTTVVHTGTDLPGANSHFEQLAQKASLRRALREEIRRF
jgi:hypothetical protein